MMSLRIRVVAFVVVALLLAVPTASTADTPMVKNGQGMESRLFRSAVDNKGHFSVDGTQILPHLAFSVSLMLDFGFNGWPAPELDNAEAYSKTTVDNYIFSGLAFNLGLLDMFVVGLQVPIAIPKGKVFTGWTRDQVDDPWRLAQERENWNTKGAIGDISVHAKLRWIRADRHPIGLGTVIQYQFMTMGKPEVLMSEPGTALAAKMILDFEPRSWYRGAINVGARYAFGTSAENVLNRKHALSTDMDSWLSEQPGEAAIEPEDLVLFKYGPMVTFGFGNTFVLWPRIMDAVVEIYGNDMLTGGSAEYLSLEANVGLKVYVERSSYLMAGYAHGIPVAGRRGDNAGYGFQGLEHRVFIGFAFEPSIGDKDGDGIKDDIDQCPDDPEDMDDFNDSDGCPDPDNDRDGVPDTNDDCPLVPEDKDGDKDEDGCPDRSEGDRDGDGILDSVDKCPDDPEDLDQFEDEDGCPDEDNDKDAIVDIKDVCPNEPEDSDGWEDQDGCPDPDNDADRIPDVDDTCPNEPETYNGKDDKDGCPDQGDVIVTKDSIKILKKIYFEYDSATIKEISYDILDQVAETINNNPQIDLIEVQGHADERGDVKYNLQLTADRAASVVSYLVKKDVKAKKLRSFGYGKYCPVDPGHSEPAWEQNRRVEFKVLSIDSNPTGVEVACEAAKAAGVVPK
ncbi:MAG: OmpA family protein [Proteobacteria bacterium]|jgi:outer membrane protein OmpA-like peptidoglycan-associated protein|nr:OmpA family protein [Pseudomonadota bacterium]